MVQDSNIHYLIILPSPPANSKSYFAVFQISKQRLQSKSALKQILRSYLTIPESGLTMAPVVQKVDNAIHGINLCPVDSAIGFPNTYPLDSDLSGG